MFHPSVFKWRIWSSVLASHGTASLFPSSLHEEIWLRDRSWHSIRWILINDPRMPFHRSRCAFPINRISTNQGPSSGSECLVRAAATAKSLQSCPTLCDPIDGSPPGSPVPGILQAKTLEWVAISFSNAWEWKVKVKSLSRFRLLATPWTAAYQAPPSMGFSRQEYWSGVPLPSPMYHLTQLQNPRQVNSI